MIASFAEATAGSTEPQFLGPYGALSAELSRRRGDIEAARAAIDEMLDRIEYCSKKWSGSPALAAAGLRMEGDAGQLARDRSDEDAARTGEREPTLCSSAPGSRLSPGGPWRSPSS